VLYLRALVDREMFQRKGRLEGEPLRDAAGPMPLKPPEVK